MLKSIIKSTLPPKGEPIDVDKAIEKLLSSNPHRKAHAWIIGRKVDGETSATIFGKFTEDLIPPVDGWTYMGRNLDSTITYTESDYQVVYGHVFTDIVIETARTDKLAVHDSNLLDESLAALDLDPSLRVTLLYNVSGCSLDAINGRYYPCGTDSGVTQFRYRKFLKEHSSNIVLNVILTIFMSFLYTRKFY